MNELRHGLETTYVNKRCRCSECKEASALGRRTRRGRRKPPKPYTPFSQYQVNRRQRLYGYDNLKAHPCMDCGGTFPPECMDFDHVRGNKLEEISVLARSSVPLEILLLEVMKCDLVCANCHRTRTKQRRSKKEV